jgi:erythromycin esterase-like protein
MTAMAILVAFSSATVGGTFGAMTPHLIKWLRERLQTRTSKPPASTFTPLDPRMTQYVQRASADWAAQRGHPEVSRLAAGYIGDAAREFQRRRGGLL